MSEQLDRDTESAEIALRLLGEPGLDADEPFPLEEAALAKALPRATARLRTATKVEERAVLSAIVSAVTKALLDLRAKPAPASGLLDVAGNPIRAEGEERGDGDPAGLRLFLLGTLRRYRGRVTSRTWKVYLDLYNAAQAGRKGYRVLCDDDLRRLTYDRDEDGKAVRPSSAGGYNRPAAEILRIGGYDL